MRKHFRLVVAASFMLALTVRAQTRHDTVAEKGLGVLSKDSVMPSCRDSSNKDKSSNSKDKSKQKAVEKVETGQTDSSKKDNGNENCFRLEPTWGERALRTFQYQYQATEQPRTVVIGGVPKMNPEHYLQQHSFNFTFSELFPSSSDFAAMISSVYSHQPDNTHIGNKALLDTTICGENLETPVVTCIARGARAWKRAIAGVKATFTVSERSAVQQNSVVPESFGYHYGYGGEVDFDPTNLFITASNYLTAINAVKGSGLTFPGSPKEALHPMLEGVEQTQTQTQTQTHTKRIRDSILAAVIPTFQFKRATQFDFIKNSGGYFVPATFPETGLNSYTLTWDARRLIAPMKVRSDAETMLKSPPPSVETLKYCVPLQNGTEIYLSVPDSFRPDACRNLASHMGAKQYRLACVAKVESGVAPNDFTMMPGEPADPKDPAKLASPPQGDMCHWITDAPLIEAAR